MGSKITFSKKALEQLNRADRKYVLITTKTPVTWILLIFISLFFMIVIFWGFYGRISENVEGVGITLLKNGVAPIISKSSGVLTHLNVRQGSSVSTDQIIGQVYDSDLFLKLRLAENDFINIGKELELLKSLVGYPNKYSRELDILTNDYQEGLNRTQRLISGIEKDFNYSEMDNELIQKDIGLEALNNVQIEQQIFNLAQSLNNKKNTLEGLEQVFHERFWLKTGKSGTVIEIFKEQGAFVTKGEKIGLVASEYDGGIYLVAYMPVEQARKLKNGMRAFFSPNVAPSSRYGYIKCVVRDFSTVPINREYIQQELMNESLTELVVADNVMFRVVLELIPDKQSKSGYAWTSNREYPYPIKNGVFGKVYINVEYRSPFSYIAPFIREFLAYFSYT
ncbi:MAG: biotin/lipoyl-binding protein [Succinivibrionaceae bacterium]